MTKVPTPHWFWWSGSTLPDLAEVWQAYIARFFLEHTFRFFKQTLRWTTPKLRSPHAADRWTWLLVLAYVQLRLAREAVINVRIPLATTSTGRTSHSRADPAWLFAGAHAPGQPGLRTKTLRVLTGAPLRQKFSTRQTLPGSQIGALTHRSSAAHVGPLLIHRRTFRSSVTLCWLKCKLSAVTVLLT